MSRIKRFLQQKIQQMHNTLHSKRGFTLIEVMLTCCVLVVLSGSLAMVMSSMQLSYVGNIETSYNRILANNIADTIKRQLSCAQITKLDTEQLDYVNEYGQQTIELGTPNPKIMGLTYDSRFYVGKEVTLHLTADEALQTFTVTVMVETLRGGNAGKVYRLQRSFAPLNATA